MSTGNFSLLVFSAIAMVAAALIAKWFGDLAALAFGSSVLLLSGWSYWAPSLLKDKVRDFHLLWWEALREMRTYRNRKN